MTQSLSQHEWENRVILLFAPDFQNQTLIQQLGFFQKNKKGLADRKLIVYQITREEVKKDGKLLKENSELSSSFNQFKVNKNEFTFILIGLDGGEKMRSSEVISREKLLSKIDRMPMRQAEIRRNKN
ncbi:MAG: hypothetical protein ACJAT4_002633 [Granulosicoccus sp.]|jgi:hypothetical protein